MTIIAPRIAVDPQVQSGKPVIEGTRIPVSVLVGAVAAGDSVEAVAGDYGISPQERPGCPQLRGESH